MADWRQIQARIRKAKAASDAPAQLAELYQRTRDAMVAFELAQFQEKAGNQGEAVEWYTTAAQRFRRAQWKTKAEEALKRLGAPVPVASAEPLAAGTAAEPLEEETLNRPLDGDVEAPGSPRSDASEGSEEDSDETAALTGEAETGAPESDANAPGKKRRRRGRRGGRKRRGRGTGAAAETAPRTASGKESTALPAQKFSPTPVRAFDSPRRPVATDTGAAGSLFPSAPSSEDTGDRAERDFAPAARERPRDSSVGEPSVGSAWHRDSGPPASSRSRTGDPGLSSRIAQLESQMRRLLACPLASLEDADQAPAGPGVLLLSDSDQVTHYYIEACQTLRIGIGNLLRGGRGGKSGLQVKPGLAEHLGISGPRLTKYLKEHCAVRWIQLDEGAPELAHFATAVLRPIVRE